MKITKTGLYETRDGEKVEIIGFTASGFPIGRVPRWATNTTWLPGGQYLQANQESGMDLVKRTSDLPWESI